MESRRVLILSESGLLAEGMRSLLGSDPRIEIVGVTADPKRAAELMRDRRPAVFVVDGDHFRLGLADAGRAITLSKVSTLITLSQSDNTAQICHIEEKPLTTAAELIEEISG